MEKSTTENFLNLIGVLGVLTLMIIWQGYVLSILWDWFIAPDFHITALGLAEAIGLTLIINYLTKSVDTDKKYELSDLGRKVFSSITMPLVALGIGWVVHFFV